LSPARVDHHNFVDVAIVIVTIILFGATASVRPGMVRHALCLLSLILLGLPLQVFDLTL
jgi:hypothetical protein